MAVRDDVDAQNTFNDRYGGEVLPATVAMEREVLGSDYGANGYTTMAQADELAALLALSSSDRLLDLGAGCGWPSLHIARLTGCHAVMTDLALPGMRRGLARARAERMATRVQAVASTARRLPFRPESFDAIVHTDVLC